MGARDCIQLLAASAICRPSLLEGHKMHLGTVLAERLFRTEEDINLGQPA